MVCEAMDRAFDKMPICAVIDENIFCAHGGIPKSATRLEDILEIPVYLPDPETSSAVAWEIIWNEPINSDDSVNLPDFSPQTSANGFFSNAKHGTGYYYTEEAAMNFFEQNGLSYIIGAHEVMPNGFKFYLKGKVITVSSSSNYCDQGNKAACISISGFRIRIIRIDTSK